MTKPDKPEPDSRAQYWNEHYVAYWKARVAESNDAAAATSKVVTGDAKTTSNASYLNAIGLLGIGKTDDVLELGCGFGRSVPALCALAKHVSAVDISAAMVAETRRNCEQPNVSFFVSAGEHLPFADGSFDAIVCFATFDAMYQGAALLEMSRLCRNDARVLITGKSDDYYDDDEAALAAEMGARAKGHPNYFTDLPVLLNSATAFGFRVADARYFPRRGDFSLEPPRAVTSGRCYEYLLILRKSGAATVGTDLVISRETSRTCARRQAAP